MATAQNIAKLVPKHDRENQSGDYTIAHRVYYVGNMSLADLSLEPRDTLPNNAQHTTDSTFVIFQSRIGPVKGEAVDMAIVTAAKAKYKTGTISGTGTQATTTMTLNSGGPFTPQMIGQTMTIAGGTPATDVVAGYTSSTVVTMTSTQSIGPVAITFPYPTTELARTRQYRGAKKTYWQAFKRFHAAPADVELLVNNLWTSYFLFNTYFPRGYAHAIDVVEEDPYVLTKSLVTVEYRTAYNPKHYPIGVATQEMYTTDDVKKLMYDLTSGTALAVDTKPNAAGYYYAVETGSNVVPDPRVIFVIRTAIARASVNYLTLAGYAGKGNLGAFSKIGGGIPIRQALCRKVAMAPDYIDDGSDAYVPLQYIFEYYDADMNLSLTARQRRRWPSAEFVLHPTNNPDLATRIYMQKDGTASANDTTTNAKTRTAMLDVWARNSATTPEVTARVPFLYADFSAIDALVSWQT